MALAIDVDVLEDLLRQAARTGRSLTYAETLNALGERFSRPKVRDLSRALDAVNQRAEAIGQPDLAVLVVRKSDGLPGDGYFRGLSDAGIYGGAFTGPRAELFIKQRQATTFAFWQGAGAPQS